MKKLRGECHETEVDIHHSLRAILKPFQFEGIKFVVSRGGRALIADEMGVGKTIQAIGVLQHYRRHWYISLFNDCLFPLRYESQHDIRF